MKAYVVGYWPRPADPRLTEVEYSPKPSTESRYATQQLAEAECEKLNRFEVRVGRHHCTFAVEMLSDGDFGVFCIDHPRCETARSSVFSFAPRLYVGGKPKTE